METALILPDEAKLKADIQAINKFQQVVHANLIEGQDFGVIPGTSQPTLLKPGAEKISKLLGLCDIYEIVDRQEDWQGPFFRYLVKCQLILVNTNIVVSEGFGECNSMESKYRYRWLWPSEVPEDFNKNEAVKRMVKGRNKGEKVPQYRVDNDDIFTQVNTLIKMAKKRSLVDAALSAGRLSNVFTQDIEDIGNLGAEPAEPESPAAADIDWNWLKESLETLNWADVAVWIRGKYKKARGTSIKELVSSLTKQQQSEFIREVQKRLDAQATKPSEDEITE